MTRFGLSTHLFHGERLARRHLESAAEHGFDLVEIFATKTHFNYHDPRAVDELGRWLSDLRIDLNSFHAPICDGFSHGVWGRAYSNASTVQAHRHEAIEETVVTIDVARRLGCPLVVLHLGLPRGQHIPPGDNDAGAVRRSLETLGSKADAAGVKLALEVMPNDLSTPDALLEILDDLELSHAAICLDFGHAHLLVGAPEAAEALSGHVVTTHVHDNNGVADSHLVPYEGTIDWELTLTAMWKVGYEGPLVFEVADHGDAAGVLTRTVSARKRLQGILKGLAEPIVFE